MLFDLENTLLLNYTYRSVSVDVLANPPPICHQEVAVGEHSRGGRLLEEPKTMLFRGTAFSLQVSIQDVPQLLWSIKPFTTCQVGTFSTNVQLISFLSISHSSFPSPQHSPLLVSHLVISKPKDSSKDTAGDH